MFMQSVSDRRRPSINRNCWAIGTTANMFSIIAIVAIVRIFSIGSILYMLAIFAVITSIAVTKASLLTQMMIWCSSCSHRSTSA